MKEMYASSTHPHGSVRANICLNHGMILKEKRSLFHSVIICLEPKNLISRVTGMESALGGKQLKFIWPLNVKLD